MAQQDYQEFVDKFKSKLTTDDCMTPPEIYDVVADWVAERYSLDRADFLRPFWPGADYRAAEYPAGKVVVDNPPFSILAKIVDWYLERGIHFFLFAPALVCINRLSSNKRRERVCVIGVAAPIIYENGANVNTSFVTDLEPDYIAMSCPELRRLVDAKSRELRKRQVKELSKYDYPPEVLTAGMLNKYSRYGVDFAVPRQDAAFVRAMDSQREHKKGIYGGGLLLSDRMAAERAAAERAAAERAAAERAAAERAAAERTRAIVWELSRREWEIVRGLGKK